MAKISGEVPNLVNGVSQQSPSLRLPSQAELSVNFNPTLLDGLVPRPNTDFLAKLLDTFPENTFTHFIMRDDAEKYVLAITTTEIKVYDFDGNLKTVTATAGLGYLSGITNPKEQLRALTVADYTFIVNKTKTVAAGTAKSPARPYEAMINVISGNYGKSYTVFVNGATAASHATPDGSSAAHGPLIATDYIASNIASQLITSTGGAYPWGIGLYTNVAYLVNNANDFTISSQDGYSDRAMKVIKKRVQKFADLPFKGINGFVCEVDGSEEVQADSYWVKFTNNGESTSGYWEECVAPDTVLGLDASTMPHTLSRQPDGTFNFSPFTWDVRKCGNAERNPNPSFVGQQINDVFFHRNRLGFLTKENIVMSEFGKFGNFFRTTLTALLDSDPIDVAASHVKVSLLRHAVPYQDVLLLFSDKTQFKLSGNELLTPKTVNARPISEVPSMTTLRPESSGSSLFFMTEMEQWASMFEYFLDKQLETADFDNVTAHCPAYVPAGVHRIAASPSLNIILLATDGEPNALYCYKFFYNGQEKLQSAWFKWTFPSCDEVVNVAWDKGFILLLLRRGTKLVLERMNFERRMFEDDGGYTIRLDFRKNFTGGSYNAGTGKTTFTMPFEIDDVEYKVVTEEGTLPKGVEVPVTSVSGTSVVVDGDYSSQPVVIGIPYECRHRFSPFFYRGPDGKKAVTVGRTQIMHVSLVYSRSAYFQVEVTPIGRSKRTIPFTGRIISDPGNMTGEIAVADGKMSFPVLSRNDRVDIDIVTNSWAPCAFTSATWQGTWNKNSQEM